MPEAVRDEAIPSKEEFCSDETHPVKWSECNVSYVLYYDNEAEPALTSGARLL